MEFLMDNAGKLYFMEMNTRIQVEHPVTEMITGVDLVAWQLRIAAGQRLDLHQEDVKITGHAIECRINAENPNENFKPAPGTIEGYQNPADESSDSYLRFDTHVKQGYRIPPYYDSMIGKLIVVYRCRHQESSREHYSNTKRHQRCEKHWLAIDNSTFPHDVKNLLCQTPERWPAMLGSVAIPNDKSQQACHC